MNDGLRTFYINLLGQFAGLRGIRVEDGNIVVLLASMFGVKVAVEGNILNVPCKQAVVKIYRNDDAFFIDWW